MLIEWLIYWIFIIWIAELPETSFTRSISNPEAVMRRRRQQKLEKKLAQFRSRDGGPDTGGTLKIYGESLCRDVPYKTLLLSVNDTAAYVVKEMLAKYSLTTYDPQQYCLVQVWEETMNNPLTCYVCVCVDACLGGRSHVFLFPQVVVLLNSLWTE